MINNSKSMKHTIRLTAAILMLLTHSGLHAQTTSSGDTFLNFLTPQTNLGFNFTQGVEYDFGADLKSPGAGDLNILRANTGLTYTERFETAFFRVGASYEYSHYDWSAVNYFDNVNNFGLNGIGNYTFEKDEPWGVFGLYALNWSAESGASYSEGFGYLVAIGPSYSLSRDLRVGLGIGVFGQPQQATRYLPIPTIDWTINKHWNIRTFNGATVTYDVHGDRDLRLDFTAQYDTRTFAIDSRPPPGRVGNPVAEENSVILVFGATKQIGGPFFIRGYVEGVVYREFQFRTDRNKYLSFKTDPSFALGFQVGASF